MDEPVRWVTKVEAVQELEVSLSTLDRMIRKGEVEVAREGRRVHVRMLGPEDPSDEELLRRAIVREDELERTVPGSPATGRTWTCRARTCVRERHFELLDGTDTPEDGGGEAGPAP